jgi:3-oxoacyl-[acyl-carrier-protein] synthase II
VRDFEPSRWLDPKEIRRTDRFTHYAIASSKLAWDDAGAPEVPSERGGIVFGTGIGGLETILIQHSVLLEKGPGRVSPFMVPALMANAAAGHLAMKFGLTGPNYCTVSACASSNHAIGEAMRMIRDGLVDLMIVGGSEAATNRLTVAAFAQMTALTKNPDPETASRPFDAGRNGFVLSEGACAMVLESEDRATARGARVYCEVAGYGASADAYHITAPDPKGSGATIAMRAALRDAAEEPPAVDYINAHGTSTQIGDEIELGAVERLLGNTASKVSMSSTKSSTGHLLGAAGAIEAIFSILAIRDNVAPPTINLENPSVETAIDLVPQTARKREINVALSNSFGFGGTNASVIVRRVAD